MTVVPGWGLRWWIAMPRALVTSGVAWWVSIDQPTTRRENTSSTTQDLARLRCIWSTGDMPKPRPAGDQIAKASSSNATATRRLAGSSTPSSYWPRRRFCTKPCPAITILVLRSCLSPRIGRSRTFSRP